MPLLQKRILIPSLIILIISAFAAGAQFSEKYGWKQFQPTFGMQNHEQALNIQFVIEDLNQNNIGKAINKLEMIQNGNILVLDQLVGNEDEHSAVYEDLLGKIASYRMNDKHKARQVSQDSGIENEIAGAINKVLKKYK